MEHPTSSCEEVECSNIPRPHRDVVRGSWFSLTTATTAWNQMAHHSMARSNGSILIHDPTPQKTGSECIPLETTVEGLRVISSRKITRLKKTLGIHIRASQKVRLDLSIPVNHLVREYVDP